MGITAILHVIRVLQGLSRLGTSETCAGFNAWDPTRIPFQKRHAMIRDGTRSSALEFADAPHNGAGG